ncbi:hypothetical protein GF357_03250 [Candidatus Dojkabacteria bacterium]|nr:hypothetical protein [Candidatus Dojkabacteria bacterium]
MFQNESGEPLQDEYHIFSLENDITLYASVPCFRTSEDGGYQGIIETAPFNPLFDFPEFLTVDGVDIQLNRLRARFRLKRSRQGILDQNHKFMIEETFGSDWEKYWHVTDAGLTFFSDSDPEKEISGIKLEIHRISDAEGDYIARTREVIGKHLDLYSSVAKETNQLPLTGISYHIHGDEPVLVVERMSSFLDRSKPEAIDQGLETLKKTISRRLSDDIDIVGSTNHSPWRIMLENDRTILREIESELQEKFEYHTSIEDLIEWWDKLDIRGRVNARRRGSPDHDKFLLRDRYVKAQSRIEALKEVMPYEEQQAQVEALNLVKDLLRFYSKFAYINPSHSDQDNFLSFGNRSEIARVIQGHLLEGRDYFEVLPEAAKLWLGQSTDTEVTKFHEDVIDEVQRLVVILKQGPNIEQNDGESE